LGKAGGDFARKSRAQARRPHGPPETTFRTTIPAFVAVKHKLRNPRGALRVWSVGEAAAASTAGVTIGLSAGIGRRPRRSRIHLSPPRRPGHRPARSFGQTAPPAAAKNKIDRSD